MGSAKIILVCVTDQKNCARLIKAGNTLAESLAVKMKILSVQPSSQMQKLEETYLEYLFNVCKSLNAEMKVYWGDDVNRIAVDYIRHNGIRQLVVGEPEEMKPGNFVYEVHQAFPDLPILIVDRLNNHRTLSSF
ncbi:hypothetical protein [Desulfitobacterium chlororespirans]|uniref:Universal stress protein family protein n=1 Tax=Desulfitobacterium chlororespirans DSM 11544 TaxID=1121395 RepID=A0A1M7SL78_9FIRM|nr:hypothetical protein [Desulfitobacterium chlororespirans]SHN59215.1 hypothetical protein SAMN02745215_01028 [Desulfitobacterium chlororespirans DSM 11544]